MPSASADNVGGHRLKYDGLMAHYSPEEAKKNYVGGSNILWTGYMELEVIRSLRCLNGIDIVDVGCGIGRLTNHLLHEKIGRYLGLDIIPEILSEAEQIAKDDNRFFFSIVNECKIDVADNSQDMFVAFSVITHLMDEEVFEYFLEARRVLRKGGIAIFSFLDFHYKNHVEQFFQHAKQHRFGHGDVLKYTTKDILNVFADYAGYKSIRFHDGLDPINYSGEKSPLVAGETLPPHVTPGQSLCILEV